MLNWTGVLVTFYVAVAAVILYVNLIKFKEAYRKSPTRRQAARRVILSVVWPVLVSASLVRGVIQVWKEADWGYERRK